MRKKWLIYGIIVMFVVVSWFAYQKITDDTYEGMSIIPEQHKDIPLFKGLKPTEHQYIMEGNHWVDIYHYYLKQLPVLGWSVEYEGSALNDNDSENDEGGFNSRWRKEGFDGELWISAHYNQFEEQTEVIFDNIPIYNSTIWIDKVPESMCISQSASSNCTEIKDKTKIEEMARFINKAIDWNKETEPRNQSKVIEFGNIQIKVLFEGDKEIYLQSVKGIKLMKPEPDFLKLLNPIQ
ncbi:MAG: hypothetical protein K0Q73_9019 [Paenibacillus sp.]|nr:hypothetical protein [Paenibacillus sp.]